MVASQSTHDFTTLGMPREKVKITIVESVELDRGTVPLPHGMKGFRAQTADLPEHSCAEDAGHQLVLPAGHFHI